jgi:hypothetical protein
MRRLVHRALWLLASGLAAGLLWVPVAATAGSAAVKCWVNADGLRECGSTVPPEYAQGGHEELRRSGAVRYQARAKTPAEAEAEARWLEEEKLRQAEFAERANLDRVLLQTFSNEDDLALTRDGKLAVIEARITVVQNRIVELERNRRVLQEQAATEERAGRGLSAGLLQGLAQVDRQLGDNRQFISEQRREQDQIRSRFAADLTRLRGLKSGSLKPGDP